MITLPFVANKTVAVMGLGKSGTATARALGASGALVLAWDDNEAARDAARAEGVTIADLAQVDLTTVDMLVWSPGIPHTHPKPHPLAEKARAHGLEPVCDVELLALARPQARFIAVTGTNGKSTTTTLAAHVLTEAGLKVAAGGNLGVAALDLPELGAGGVYVLELSSYQLELTRSLKLAAGVCLNITPDHLGRHGGMDGYVAAKARLFDFVAAGSGIAIIGVDDQPCRDIAARLTAGGARVVPISTRIDQLSGVSATDGVLRDHGHAVTELDDIATLPGRHNWQNACAAFALARALGVDAATAAAAIARYPGLAHRQELVRERAGVRYVNDSKATNADAAEVALVCYDAIHWIIGGQAKEGGIVSLEPCFPRIRHAYLIGDAAAAFAATLDGKVAFTQCGTLDRAVAAAAAAAQPGEVVLLSPACASWDQFKSFEHRGEVFRHLVEALP